MNIVGDYVHATFACSSHKFLHTERKSRAQDKKNGWLMFYK